ATIGGYEAPYQGKNDADFTNTQRLIRKCALKGWPLTERKFLFALKNYLATPQGSHTLADLASRFSSFYRSALDRYSKPITTHSGAKVGSNGSSAHQETVEAPPPRSRNGQWGRALNLLDATIGKEAVTSWFEPLDFLGVEDSQVKLRSPDAVFRDWID